MDKSGDVSALQNDISQIYGPGGSTPLVWAVEEALSEIQAVSKPRSIVVITDDLDSCGGDLCAAVRAANAQEEQITVHTVGLDMNTSSQEFQVLQCAASESHLGTSQNIEKDGSPVLLEKAIRNVVKDMEDKTPPGYLRVNITNLQGGNASVGYTVKDSKGKSFSGESGNRLALRHGVYTLTDPLTGTQHSVTIKPAEETVLSFESNLGYLEASAECPPKNFTYIIHSNGISRTVTFDGKGIDLQPGNYEVMLPRYPNVSSISITIEQSKSVPVSLGSYGELIVRAKGIPGIDSWPFEAKDKTTGNVAATGATGEAVTIPEGTYNIIIPKEHRLSGAIESAYSRKLDKCKTLEVELKLKAVVKVCGNSGEVEFISSHNESFIGKINELFPVSPVNILFVCQMARVTIIGWLIMGIIIKHSPS